MKKIMAVVLSLAVLFAFAACSDGPTKFFGKDVLGVVVESAPDYIEKETLNPADVDLRVIFNDGSEAVYSGAELGMDGTFKLKDGENKFTVNFGLASDESTVDSKKNEVVINAAKVTKLVIDPTNAPKELLPDTEYNTALDATGLVFKAEYGNSKSKEVSLDLAKELVSGLALTPVVGDAGDELEIKVTTVDSIAEVSPKWTVTVADTPDYFKEFRVEQILDKDNQLFNIGKGDQVPHTLKDVKLSVSAVYEYEGIEIVDPLEVGTDVTVSWGKYAETFDLRRTDQKAPTSVVLTMNEGEDNEIERTVAIPGGLKFTEDYATMLKITFKNEATKLELAAGKEILSSMFEYYATEWASGKDVKDADKGDAITDSSLFEVKPGRVPYGTPAGETVDLTFTYKANSTVTPDPASNAEHITVI